MKILGIEIRKFNAESSTINVVETWCVKWSSVHPWDRAKERFDSNIEVMSFVTKEDAEAFAKELKDASRLLKNGDQSIKVYKQEHPSNL